MLCVFGSIVCLHILCECARPPWLAEVYCLANRSASCLSFCISLDRTSLCDQVDVVQQSLAGMGFGNPTNLTSLDRRSRERLAVSLELRPNNRHPRLFLNGFARLFKTTRKRSHEPADCKDSGSYPNEDRHRFVEEHDRIKGRGEHQLERDTPIRRVHSEHCHPVHGANLGKAMVRRAIAIDRKCRRDVVRLVSIYDVKLSTKGRTGHASFTLPNELFVGDIQAPDHVVLYRSGFAFMELLRCLPCIHVWLSHRHIEVVGDVLIDVRPDHRQALAPAR